MLQYYYHGTIRKVVIAFASLFNNIYISRKGENGEEIERIKVPLAYGAQQKFIKRLDRIGKDFDQQAVRLETYLPRICFEIGTMTYDSSRKLNSIQRTAAYYDRDNFNARFEKVPYNMSINLGVMAKNMEDCLQIIEQIIPYFTPEYVFTIKAIPGMDDDVDIPIVLSSVSFTDGDDGSYGDYASRKVNLASMGFTAKIYLYGPVNKIPAITEVEGNIFDSRDFGVTGAKKYADIGVTADDGVTAGSFNPAITGHAHVIVREYPPEAWN